MLVLDNVALKMRSISVRRYQSDEVFCAPQNNGQKRTHHVNERHTKYSSNEQSVETSEVYYIYDLERAIPHASQKTTRSSSRDCLAFK